MPSSRRKVRDDSNGGLRAARPIASIILVCGFIGGLVIMALRQAEYKILSKRGCYFEPNVELVLELRAFGHKLAEKIKEK